MPARTGKDERNLAIHFRTVHFLQAVAIGALAGGLFLVWWRSDESLNAFDLLSRSAERLLDQEVTGVGHPLLVLWWLWPTILVAGLRAAIGLIVPPVSFGWLALVLWVPAALALVHFEATFGGNLPARSPLDAGSVGSGYWLTVMALIILGVLLVIERRLQRPADPWEVQGVVRGGSVEDAQRLWEGTYQTCPHCGMLNEPGARTCYNCQNLLFDFTRGL